jgi:hypothetical protein
MNVFLYLQNGNKHIKDKKRIFRAYRAVAKEFPKGARSHMKGLPKAVRPYVIKFAKSCQLQRLLVTL